MFVVSGQLGCGRYAFTDRHGGVSWVPYADLNLGAHVGDDPAAVETNRRRLLAALPGARRLSFTDQVHGCGVVVVDGAEDDAAQSPPEADAQLTTTPGLALCVLTADCVPVLIATRDRPARPGAPHPEAVGVAHAGRLGVQRGVVPALVQAFARLGAQPPDLVAVVGPAVCGRCYEVPAEVRDEVAEVVPEARVTTRAGTPGLDLPGAVLAQLHAAGVVDVRDLGVCTIESPALFSHRREQVTGRQAGVVWIPA